MIAETDYTISPGVISQSDRTINLLGVGGYMRLRVHVFYKKAPSCSVVVYSDYVWNGLYSLTDREIAWSVEDV